MNIILEKLHLLAGRTREVAEIAEKHSASLEGGDVATAETMLVQIANEILRITDVVAAASGRCLPSIESGFDVDAPVPFEIAPEVEEEFSRRAGE